MADGYEPTARQALANEVDRASSQLYRRIFAFASRELAPDGIGQGKQAVLRILSEKDGLSLSSIAEAGALDRGNVTRIVAALEDKGYLRRENDPEARHGYLVFLTESGKAACLRMHQVLDTWNEELFARLTRAELAGLAAAMSELAERSNALWARYRNGELAVREEAGGLPC